MAATRIAVEPTALMVYLGTGQEPKTVRTGAANRVAFNEDVAAAQGRESTAVRRAAIRRTEQSFGHETTVG
jgi:hypothetical protein